jgi:hypothetical protein
VQLLAINANLRFELLFRARLRTPLTLIRAALL